MERVPSPDVDSEDFDKDVGESDEELQAEETKETEEAVKAFEIDFMNWTIEVRSDDEWDGG